MDGTVKRWRPEGWESMFTDAELAEAPNEDVKRFYQVANCNYEAGADDMLEALRKMGKHSEGWLRSMGPGKLPEFMDGTDVFIPDDKEG